MTAKTGYVNGSDMLLYISGKAVGHCTSHSTTFTSESKDRSVKPVSTEKIASSMWKGKGVTGLSISISADGLCFYDEKESGFKELFTAWKAGQSVEVKCMEREASEKPYLSGHFIITSLERTDPAQDDATYKIQLENDGAITLSEENLSLAID